ncbi:MAG: ABC transporter substrate-binding protein [Alistipes sp.]|nr:ABC transporter substrate-binding protein [Alistipes sp.]MBR0394683.1 ABC transporter substrate-binding protein [Alistipes sp.]
MKKLFTKILAAVVLSLSLFTAEAADREHTLKIYNWADYIDESVLDDFKVWYKEQTGEEVDVIYQLFDINEIMLAKIEKGKEDFDVVCPSEYIIERMLRSDMLLPITQDFGDTPNYLENISPYIKERFDKIDGHGKNANDYAVGYMWGTTGVLYNTRYVTKEEAATWKVFHNEKFAKKIFIKDAFRDVYSTILVYLRQKELADGTITLDKLMYDSSDESIADVEAFLKQAKPLVAGWEADFGKEMMTQEKAYLNLTWSGDAVWAIEEAAEVGVTLDYVVPIEGSNVWFDGWVIPKYAVNTKAASYFINFMCRSDIAIRNMDEIGYVSVIATDEVLEAQWDDEMEQTVDASYFFGEGVEKAKINPVMYPDKSVIERCAMMHDSGARTPKLLEMWARVKGDDVPLWNLAVIVVSFGVLLVLGIRRKMQKRISHRRQRKANPKRKK